VAVRNHDATRIPTDYQRIGARARRRTANH
jgi:hypothetical protein